MQKYHLIGKLIIDEIILFREILKNRFITRKWNIMLANENYLFLADEETSTIFVTNVIILMKLWLVLRRYSQLLRRQIN